MSRSHLSKLLSTGLFMAAVLLLPAVAAACPTCKDGLGHDPATANLARGYAYSILFMLSMPPLIFGGLSAYFYWEVRRARARQQAEQSEQGSRLAIDSQ